MPKRDICNTLDFVNLLPPAANANISTTPLVSNVLDVRGCRAAMIAIPLGALTDADAVYAVLVEEGDGGTVGTSTLTDAATVADIDLNGTAVLAGFTFASDNGVRKIGYSGSHDYIRVTITPTVSANSGNTPLCILGIVERDYAPTANPPA